MWLSDEVQVYPRLNEVPNLGILASGAPQLGLLQGSSCGHTIAQGPDQGPLNHAQDCSSSKRQCSSPEAEMEFGEVIFYV